MNLQQLRYLRETVRRGLNLTAAAQAMHTSQPGLSKAIRELEDELGITIFVRHGRRLVQLTDEGREVLAMVERLLIEADNLKRAARDWRAAEEGELRIAATHTQARYTLPPAIARLRAKYPRVTVRLHQGSPTQIARMLRGGEAELGIATEALDAQPDLHTEPLFTWYHAAIAAPDHPLVQAKTVTLADLAEHDVITYDLEFAGRTRIDAAFRRAGVAPRIVLEATDSDVIKTYVALGLGIGIVSELALGDGDDARLRTLPIGRPFEANVTRIAYRAGHMLRGFERHLVDLLRAPDAGPRPSGGEEETKA